MKLSPHDPLDLMDATEEPDFVVVDVETACARVSSICQIGIVGFRQGREVFAYETLVDPCDEFPPSTSASMASRPSMSPASPVSETSIRSSPAI